MGKHGKLCAVRKEVKTSGRQRRGIIDTEGKEQDGVQGCWKGVLRAFIRITMT